MLFFVLIWAWGTLNLDMFLWSSKIILLLYIGTFLVLCEGYCLKSSKIWFELKLGTYLVLYEGYLLKSSKILLELYIGAI